MGIVLKNVGWHKLLVLTGKQKPQLAAVSG